MSDAVLLERLKLLATRVRKKYGRVALRSCGLDDMENRGIVTIPIKPTEFDPGRALPPVHSRFQPVLCDQDDCPGHTSANDRPCRYEGT